MRLDKRVAERFGLSRRGADRAVRRRANRRGRADVLRPCAKSTRRLIDLHAGRPRPETTARRIKVMYEDHHVLIVDKPAGLLTQPTPDRERDTLLERAGRYLAQTRGPATPYVGFVHRIDKQTSGVILLVCTPKALRPFQTLFRTHAIERSYLAVVEGIVKPRRGLIDLPLSAIAATAAGVRAAATKPVCRP